MEPATGGMPPRPASRNPWGAAFPDMVQVPVPAANDQTRQRSGSGRESASTPLAQTTDSEPLQSGTGESTPSGSSEATAWTQTAPAKPLGHQHHLAPKLPMPQFYTEAAQSQDDAVFYTARSKPASKSGSKDKAQVKPAPQHSAVHAQLSCTGSLQSYAHSPRTPSRGSADVPLQNMSEAAAKHDNAVGMASTGQAASQGLAIGVRPDDLTSALSSAKSVFSISNLSDATSLLHACDTTGTPTMVRSHVTAYYAALSLSLINAGAFSPMSGKGLLVVTTKISWIVQCF